MGYKLAVVSYRVGHYEDALSCQICLGLKQGYDGFVQEKGAVLSFLTDLYKVALMGGKNYIAFLITDAVITYAYKNGGEVVVMHEPSLLLASTMSPLYTSETEEEWKTAVEEYATKLAEKFEQFRVYVEYSRKEIKILQKS